MEAPNEAKTEVPHLPDLYTRWLVKTSPISSVSSICTHYPLLTLSVL